MLTTMVNGGLGMLGTDIMYELGIRTKATAPFPQAHVYVSAPVGGCPDK